jgi:DNA-directed RNA polymerase subunit RPC12/RpoP
MTDTHCPGFESNKALSEVKVKCSACGKEWEIFSDELEKSVKCPDCGVTVDAKTCAVK